MSQRHAIIWIVTALISTATVTAAFQATAAGSRREPQFANAQAQSWKSTILPNQPLSLHRHDHGRAIIALTDGTLDIVNGKGETLKQYTWQAGKAYWLDADPPGQMHADLNRGSKAIEVIVVELQ
ncbi:MAG: hypothetical protein AB7H96_07970 [Vicinamibacterales bacterium]